MALDIEQRLQLQEDEYFLPYHWMLNHNGKLRYRALSRLLAQLILAKSPPEQGKVLDIGCGDACGGNQIRNELGRQCQIWGIDFSRRALRFANIMTPEIKVVQGKAQNLPFPENSFDAVYAREVIEHVPDDLEMVVLREAVRVLKPGGTLILTAPSVHVKLGPKHFRHYSTKMVSASFRELGLINGEIYGFGLIIPRPLEATYKLFNSFPYVWRWFTWRWQQVSAHRAIILVAAAEKPLRGLTCYE